jgi:hypothetical protein
VSSLSLSCTTSAPGNPTGQKALKPLPSREQGEKAARIEAPPNWTAKCQSGDWSVTTKSSFSPLSDEYDVVPLT